MWGNTEIAQYLKPRVLGSGNTFSQTVCSLTAFAFKINPDRTDTVNKHKSHFMRHLNNEQVKKKNLAY